MVCAFARPLPRVFVAASGLTHRVTERSIAEVSEARDPASRSTSRAGPRRRRAGSRPGWALRSR